MVRRFVCWGEIEDYLPLLVADPTRLKQI